MTDATEKDRLSAVDIKASLTSMGHSTGEGWTMDGDRIVRTITFDSFLSGVDFVNRVAGVAEAINHHPDIAIHYKTITVSCWTHDVGGITARDFELAKGVDEVVGDQLG